MLAPKNYLILSFLLLLLSPSPGAAAGTSRYKMCGGTGVYSANSTYRSNLNLILSSLLADASCGFSAGVAGQPPDQVSSLALCRGDVNASACSSCLGAGAVDVLDLCPYDKDAVVWYDYCLIRYSNLHFLNSSTDNSKQVIFVNPGKVGENSHLFNKMVTRLVNTTAAWAVYNTTRRFATSVANSTAEVPPIYGFVF
uniref:Gnk2-homologous domain-containing protein n=1 Tax=Ananas comosus var. bracteatus TaxID=296719 RepID=A0A6V7PES3_ANACO|nr:unnamed protein product [Ananas comosus var. bracteatus]